MIFSDDFFTIPDTTNREDPHMWHHHNFSEHSHIALDAQRLLTQVKFAH